MPDSKPEREVKKPPKAPGTLTKADLIEAVSAGLPDAPTTEEAVDLVFEMITRALKAGDTVELPGFGVFTVRSRDASKFRDPRTGEETELPARKNVVFRPGPRLREPTKKK